MAKKSTYQLEKEKEEKLGKQIEKCKLFAPGDGLVVYANEPNRFGGSSQPLIEEGATVRERQKIFSLPDIDRMRVNTKVYESMCGLELTGKDHIYVRTPRGWRRREVKLSISNDKLIAIREGLAEGEEVALSPQTLMTEAEKREAFAVASGRNGPPGAAWSADGVKAGASPGASGPGGARPNEAATKKRGGGSPAFRAKFQQIPPEDRAKLFNPNTSDADREAILRKAGFTDAEIEPVRQLRSQLGGGFGGRGPVGPGGEPRP